jgi:hypothetical protein
MDVAQNPHSLKTIKTKIKSKPSDALSGGNRALYRFAAAAVELLVMTSSRDFMSIEVNLLMIWQVLVFSLMICLPYSYFTF